MKLKNLFWFALPLLAAVGCAYQRYPSGYTETYVAPTPTSTRNVVRVYPDTSVSSSSVPADEWANAMAVRNMIAGDSYLKGAARNVDVEVIHNTAILRGTVVSEYDRQELAARIAQVPGITSVDNRLLVAAR